VNEPRFQFTLRQLMVLVAFCAISLALIETPAILVILAIWIVLPGIAIDRAQGGEGIVGGAIAGQVAAVVIMTLLSHVMNGGLWSIARRSAVFSAVFAMPAGIIFGAVVSDGVCRVLGLPRRREP
jgi:hypothetical protein